MTWMTRHSDRCDCFGCKVRSIQFPRARDRSKPPRTPNASWERGIAGSHRPDGSFMPILDERWAPMSLKEYASKRSIIAERRRRWHNTTKE